MIQRFDDEERRFCCHGCACVYELVRENDLLDQVLPEAKTARPRIPSLALNPGCTTHFSLDGMYCAGCAVVAERILANRPGVKSVDVSFAAGRGRLQFDPDVVDPEQALKQLDRLGYQARILTDPSAQRVERQQESLLLQLVVALAFGMQVMLLYLVRLYPLYLAGDYVSHDARNFQYLVWLLATPVLFFGGVSFLRGAWRSLLARTANMDTLVSLGLVSAYGYSAFMTLTGRGEAYFDSVAMITSFVLIGRYLEALGCASARKDVRSLLNLQPESAWRRDAEGWLSIAADSLCPGDTILIKRGERVPADARIVDGVASVDASHLTGESLPVSLQPGDTVFAGTVVTDAPLVCQVTQSSKSTRLARITQLVDETLSAKLPVQRMADRASSIFVAAILSVSVVTLLGWWAAGLGLESAIMRSVAVLVVACPCALGLATPLALTVTLGNTTRHGVLMRNPAALETVQRVDRVVLDKTGTLTQGRLTVTEVVAHPNAGLDAQELLCLAAAVEQFSEHPVARAIVGACGSCTIPSASEYRSHRGMGVSADVGGAGERRVMVGSSRLFTDETRRDLAGQARARADRGEMVVWIGRDDHALGFVACRDQLNPTAKDALHLLRKDGTEVVMLSGDSAPAVRAVARELELEEFAGDCIPDEKAAAIRRWQSEGERVAMVGDGVNDAPALAQADLSITVAGGTDVAGETSDIILSRSDVTLIPWLIRLAQRTRRVIRQNLAWAFAYNLVAIPLACFGLIGPPLAAAAMAASSLLVVSNSLRLKR